nr:hypothetical protein [Tanacetum cinerariifolium]
ESVVVTSSSLEMLTNSCLEGIMVSLIFLEVLEQEGLVEFMVEWFEEDEDDIFTTALGRERIEFLINKLGMRSFTPETLQQLTDEVDE